MYKEISEIMDNFDFDKVLDVMRYLDWNWGMSVPTMDEIKENAFRLLVHASTNVPEDGTGFYSISSGGFCATSYIGADTNKAELELEFVLSSWGTD